MCQRVPGRRRAKVYEDPERTLAGLREHDAGDRRAGPSSRSSLRLSPTIFDLYGLAPPSAAAALAVGRALRRLGPAPTLHAAQRLLSSTRELGDLYMEPRGEGPAGGRLGQLPCTASAT
jgi:hypothetical protein